MKEGRGVLVDQKGDQFEGEWRNDQQNGSGTLMTKGGVKVRADWVQGLMKVIHAKEVLKGKMNHKKNIDLNYSEI